MPYTGESGWLGAVRQLPELEAGAPARLQDIFVQLIVQRFRHMTRREVETMLQLTPIEDTVLGLELMQQGMLHALRGDLLDVLEIRFGGAPEPARTAIAGISNPDDLKTLHRQALLADSLAAFERVLDR